MNARARYCLMLIIPLCVIAAGVPRAAFSKGAPPKSSGETTANLENIGGPDIFVRRAGKVLWETGTEGMALEPGDAVRTGSHSTAKVSFGPKGFVKLFPMTSITVESAASPDGTLNGVVVMKEGKAWTQIDFSEKGGQFFVMTQNAIVNSRSVNAFVETSDKDKNSCLDIFQGSAAVRQRHFPEDAAMLLQSKQRMNVEGEKIVMPMNDMFDATQTNRSCMAKHQTEETDVAPQAATPQTGTPQPEAAQPAAAESKPPEAGTTKTTGTHPEESAATAEDEMDVDISVSASVTFVKPGQPTESGPEEIPMGFVSETPEAPANETTTTADQAAESKPETPAAQEPAGTEDEYETLEVTASMSFGVTKPAEETTTATTTTTAVCAEAPEIINVLVSGKTVAAGDAVLAPPASKCGSVAKPAIRWSSVPKCGSVAAVTISVNGKITKFPGGEQGETVMRENTFEIADEEAREVVIKATNANGKSAQLAFTVAIAPPDEKLFPRVTSLMVNGNLVKANSTMYISADTCEAQNMALEGIVKSDCGEINAVEVRAYEAPVTVYGTDEWTAAIVSKTSQNIPVTVMAKDVTGARGKPFKFNIEYTTNIPLPEVAIDTIVNTPAPDIGEEMDVYRNELVGGKLTVSGTAGSGACGLKKVEVSVDNGSSWVGAGNAAAWTFGFSPKDGAYEILARAKDENDNLSPEMFQPVVVNYFSKTLEELLRETFDRLIQAYQDKDANSFLDDTDTGFTTRYDSIEDRNRLDSALNGKFSSLASLFLRVSVQSVQVSGRTSGRVSFQWEANPTRGGYSKSGIWSFIRERRAFKLQAVEDNRTFLRYTDAVDSIEITSSKSMLTADGEDKADITVKALDSAENPVKDGAAVNLSATSGAIPSSVRTSGGAATVTYTAGVTVGTTTVTAASGGVSASLNLNMSPEYAPGLPPTPTR